MNDPIFKLTVVPPQEVKDDFLRPYSLTTDEYKSLIDQLSKLTFDRITLETEGEKNNLDPIYCDIKKYSILQQLKEVYSLPESKQFISTVYPYENANNSIFMNRCGLKLANLDKIFQLTG